MSEDVAVDLRAYLSARLAPLAVLLVVVVSVTAPVALFVLGQQTLELQAHESAGQVAEVIRREAEQRPRLWKYDTPKLLAHLRTYSRRENIRRIDVVDAEGHLLDPDEPDASGTAEGVLFWQSVPVVLGDETVGAVWVAVDATDVRREALQMLVPFGALGLLLAGLMYWLPLRAMGSAEDRVHRLLEQLRESQGALATLNENLEQTVETRSSELSKALRELQEKEQGLRELSARAVSMQEAERRAIARELHDSAGQSLTAIRIHMQLIGELVAKEGEGARAADLSARTLTMVDGTLEEIRRAVNTLGPAVLDDVGLAEAIGRACDDLADALGIAVDCRLDLDDRTLSPALETTAYRLVQEALTNITRYAEATEVAVRVYFDDGAMHVVVTDDGRGFDPDDVVIGRSRGLVGMRERAELLGGRLELQSAPGQGTTVRAMLPLSQEG
ncbi:MAG: ATP-binding protein [Myxococcota bacterium]